MLFSSTDTIFYIAILLMSVVVHEVAHGVAALHFGDETAKLQGRLTLNPLKHLDLFGSIILPLILVLTHSPFLFGWAKPVPYNPANLRNQRWGTLAVASAGIIVNISLALIFSLLLYIAPSLGIPVDQIMPSSFVVIVDLIIFVNLLLAVFNLIPIPPLDGSKILFSLLPVSLRRVEAMIEKYSFPILIIFILFIWKFIAPLILYIFAYLTGAQL